MSESITSKSIQFSKHGNPGEVLSLQDVTLPAQVQDGHVRIKVHARPINPSDSIFIAGYYNNSVGDQIVEGKPQTAGKILIVTTEFQFPILRFMSSFLFFDSHLC